jgi:hypothetical protein
MHSLINTRFLFSIVIYVLIWNHCASSINVIQSLSSGEFCDSIGAYPAVPSTFLAFQYLKSRTLCVTSNNPSQFFRPLVDGLELVVKIVQCWKCWARRWTFSASVRIIRLCLRDILVWCRILFYGSVYGWLMNFLVWSIIFRDIVATWSMPDCEVNSWFRKWQLCRHSNRVGDTEPNVSGMEKPLWEIHSATGKYFQSTSFRYCQ